MKFRVERDVLAEAVTWTARSLSPRPPVPVLSGLLLKAEAGTVSLSSFDYETSARLEIPADIADEGTILVSGRLLADICRSADPDGLVKAMQGQLFKTYLETSDEIADAKRSGAGAEPPRQPAVALPGREWTRAATADRGHEQRVELRAAEGAHRGLLHRYFERAVEPAEVVVVLLEAGEGVVHDVG